MQVHIFVTHCTTNVCDALLSELFLEPSHAYHIHLLVFRHLDHRRDVHSSRECRTVDLILSTHPQLSTFTGLWYTEQKSTYHMRLDPE